MSRFSEQYNLIRLRAPDDFISGLLCVAVAAVHAWEEGGTAVLPARPGAWYLLAPQDSQARVTCGTEAVELEPGQALALRADATVDVRLEHGGALAVLGVAGRVAQELLTQSAALGGSVYPDGGAPLHGMLTRLADIQPAEATRASAEAYGLLTGLYGRGIRARKPKKSLPLVVEAAMGILQREFAFLDGIGELAQRLEVSQEYLTRTFRDHVGMTPGKYLNRLRVEQAKVLLCRGDHNVAFVADACGFANANYFARVFRSLVGQTPTAYARQNGSQPGQQPSLDSMYVL